MQKKCWVYSLLPRDLNGLSLLRSYFIELLNLFSVFNQRVFCIFRTLTKISTFISYDCDHWFLPKTERFLLKKKSNSAQKVAWVKKQSKEAKFRTLDLKSACFSVFPKAHQKMNEGDTEVGKKIYLEKSFVTGRDISLLIFLIHAFCKFYFFNFHQSSIRNGLESKNYDRAYT